MGVGAGLYMYDVVVKKFTFAISSTDELLSIFSEKQQEGQHSLTGQRAANFRLLANQWAERRLVMQWRHGCRAMGRSVCNAGASMGVGPFALMRSDIKGTELPCQYIDTTRKAINCATTL